jgi:hypothetical protein
MAAMVEDIVAGNKSNWVYHSLKLRFMDTAGVVLPVGGAEWHCFATNSARNNKNVAAFAECSCPEQYANVYTGFMAVCEPARAREDRPCIPGRTQAHCGVHTAQHVAQLCFELPQRRAELQHISRYV